MAKHPLDDHVIEPERVIIEAKKLLVSRMIGKKWTCRMGEQYMASCTCGSMIITSDDIEVLGFEERHRGCLSGD